MPERRYDQAAPPAYEPVRREGWDSDEVVQVRCIQDYPGRVAAEAKARTTKTTGGKEEVEFDSIGFINAVLYANIGHKGTLLRDETGREYVLPEEVFQLPPGAKGFLFNEIERRDGSIRRESVIQIPGLGAADFRKTGAGVAEQAGQAEQETAGPPAGGQEGAGGPHHTRNGLDTGAVAGTRAGRA